MADKLFNFSLACPIHPKFPITHGCSLGSCNSQILHCSACLIESVEHTHNHQTSIIPIGNYYSVAYHCIESAREKIKPFYDILSAKEDHFKMYSNYIKSKKKNLELEFNKLLDSINYFFERLKEVSFKRLDDGQILLKKLYDKLEHSLSSEDLDFLKIQSEPQLSEKVSALERSKLEGYLQNLRKRIIDLEKPQTSNIYRSLSGICFDLKNFKKDRDTRKIDFSEYSHKYLKPYLSEVERAVKEHISVICSSVSRNVSSGMVSPSYSEIMKNQNAKNMSEFTQKDNENPIKHLEAFSLVKAFERESDSPFQDIRTKESEDNYGNKMLSRKFDKIFAFPSVTKTEPEREDSSPYKREAIFHTEKADKSPNRDLNVNPSKTDISTIPKKTFKTISSLSCDYSTSVVTCLNLSKAKFVVSSKDYMIRVVEITQNHQPRVALEFEVKNESCYFTNFIRLNNSNGDFLCGGNTKGNIYIWNIDELEANLEKGKTPLANLITQENEEITSIFDVGDDTHLLSASSKGNIFIWNYMQGNLEGKLNFKEEDSGLLLGDKKVLFYVSACGRITKLEVKYSNSQVSLKEERNFEAKARIYSACLFNEHLIVSTDSEKVLILEKADFKVFKEVSVNEIVYQIIPDARENRIFGVSESHILEFSMKDYKVECFFAGEKKEKLVSELTISNSKLQILESQTFIVCGDNRFDKELAKIVKLE